MSHEKLTRIKKGLERSPNNADLWIKYARILFEEEIDLNEAILAQVKVQELTGTDNRLKMAHLYALNNEKERAINIAKEVVREKKSESSYKILIDVLIGNENYSEAIEVLELALESFPENSDFYYYLGIAFKNVQTHSGKYELVIDSLKKSISLDPRNSDAYEELGSTFCDMGRLKEGLLLMRKAIQLDPDDGWLKASLAMKLWQAGYYSKAEIEFKAAINSKVRDERFKGWYQAFLEDQQS